MEIRPLNENDAAAWYEIRLEALESDPFAFGKSAEELRAVTVETIAQRFRESSSRHFNLGAFENGQLVGTATFMREKGLKEQHKGHVYAVYVCASQRVKGAGHELIAALVEKAKQDSSLDRILLCLAATRQAARKVYRAIGFEPFGTEPRSLQLASPYI